MKVDQCVPVMAEIPPPSRDGRNLLLPNAYSIVNCAGDVHVATENGLSVTPIMTPWQRDDIQLTSGHIRILARNARNLDLNGSLVGIDLVLVTDLL
jgi:hypothetical protein